MEGLFTLNIKDYLAPGLKKTEKAIDKFGGKTDTVTNNVTKEFKEAGNQVNKFKQKVDKVADSSTKKFGGLKSGIGGIADKIQGVASKAGIEIPKLGDLAGMAKNPYLLLGAVITSVVLSVGKIATEVTRVSVESVKATRSIQTLMGVGQEEATKLTPKLQAISKVYDTDIKESIQAANVISKEFGLTQEKSVALLQKGFVAGANETGEYITQTKEYMSQLKDAGLDASKSLGLITSGVKLGIFTDKAPDAIKEFKLRVLTETDKVKKALTGAFGDKVATEMIQGIQSGKVGVFETLQDISKGLNNTNLGQDKIQTVISDLFGGAGEDAGTSFVKNLHKINLNLDDMANEGAKINRHNVTRLGLEEEIATKIATVAPVYNNISEQVETLKLKAQSMFYDGVIGFTNLLKPVINFVREIRNAYNQSQYLQDRVKVVTEVARMGFRIAMIPFRAFWNGLKAVKSTFIALGKVLEPTTNQFNKFYAQIRQPLLKVWNIAKGIMDTFINIASFDLKAAKASFKGVKAEFSTEVTPIVKVADNGNIVKDKKVVPKNASETTSTNSESGRKNTESGFTNPATTSTNPESGFTNNESGYKDFESGFTNNESGYKNYESGRNNSGSTPKSIIINIEKIIGVENIINENGEIDKAVIGQEIIEEIVRQIRGAELSL